MCFTQFPTQSLHSSLKKKSAFSVYILNVNLFKKKKKGLSHVAFLSPMEIWCFSQF